MEADSYELLKINSTNIPGPAMHDPSVPVNRHKRTYEYISYKDALENLSIPSERHLNEKKFLDLNDEENRTFLVDFQLQLDQFISRDLTKYIKFRGRKHKSFSAWVLLVDDCMPFGIDAEFLEEQEDNRELKVTAVTLLNSKEEERGVRISLKEDKSRLYEIVHGVYEFKFHWKVGDRKCTAVVQVSSNGRVAFGNIDEDYTDEDIRANRSAYVRIGGREFTLADLIWHGTQMKELQFTPSIGDDFVWRPRFVAEA